MRISIPAACAFFWSIYVCSLSAETMLTYQGRLADSGVAATGVFDMTFQLFVSETGADQFGDTIPMPGVTVTEGLFTVVLDFGADVFDGSPRWLEIALRPQGSTNEFTPLLPRHRVTSTPYAIVAERFVGSVPDSQLSPNVARLNTPVTFSATVRASEFIGSGASLSNVNAATLNGLDAGAFWKLGGNQGTTPGSHFVGTSDNQPLELKVNGTRALRLQPGTNGAPDVIGGSAQNSVAPGTDAAVIGGGDANTILQGSSSAVISGGRGHNVFGPGASIAGGISNIVGETAGDLAGENCAIGGGSLNRTFGEHNTIAGGKGNTSYAGEWEPPAFTTISGGVSNIIAGLGSTISGGGAHLIEGSGTFATIGGGDGNRIASDHDAVTIAGGKNNSSDRAVYSATIGGGEDNTIRGFSTGATIGGGINNAIRSFSGFGTIPGGKDNEAGGAAFAAGTRAKAVNLGSFVWGDYGESDIASTNDNSVTMRARGGYRLFSDPDATIGATLAPGSGSWISMSDRNAKERTEPVNPREILEKLAALPVTTWNYKAQQDGTRHIGPMAQDFKAAFHVGETDTGISTVDAQGVAFSAIQGLYELLREKDKELSDLKKEVRELKEKLGN